MTLPGSKLTTLAPPNPKSEKAKQICTNIGAKLVGFKNTKYYFFSLKLTSLTQISP
jgi:hypothetical protein